MKDTPDTHLMKMVTAKKGKIVSSNGKVAAYVDNEASSKTVRAANCELLCKF